MEIPSQLPAPDATEAQRATGISRRALIRGFVGLSAASILEACNPQKVITDASSKNMVKIETLTPTPEAQQYQAFRQNITKDISFQGNQDVLQAINALPSIDSKYTVSFQRNIYTIHQYGIVETTPSNETLTLNIAESSQNTSERLVELSQEFDTNGNLLNTQEQVAVDNTGKFVSIDQALNSTTQFSSSQLETLAAGIVPYKNITWIDKTQTGLGAIQAEVRDGSNTIVYTFLTLGILQVSK